MIWNWVKRLGQWHLQKDDEAETLCGKPMLGNNYAKHIPVKDRQKCDACFNIKNQLEAQNE